jgi:CheY-like chemotaxis protein
MPPVRTILALGDFHPEQRKRIESAGKETGFELQFCQDVEAAMRWLDGHDPRVVLFDTTVAKVHSLLLRVRGKKNLASVPLIGLAKLISDAALSKLFAAGADDVALISGRDPLLSRLRATPSEQSLRPAPDRGRALVADGDHDRCSVMGRTLANAGYDVRFAVNRRSLEHHSTEESLKLVVASVEFGTPEWMLGQARKAGSDAAWILTDIERDVAAGVDPIPSFDRAVLVSAFVPPESLLFLSNELMSAETTSKRIGPRMLHGTVVTFRDAGSEEDDLGFTYNVSFQGLFVRTLRPPESKSVWIELRPPGSSRLVRLEGEVVWSRPFTPGQYAITPPGFGMRIRSGLADDFEVWHKSVDAVVSSARKRPRLDELVEEALRDSLVQPEPLPKKASVGPPPLPTPGAGPVAPRIDPTLPLVLSSDISPAPASVSDRMPRDAELGRASHADEILALADMIEPDPPEPSIDRRPRHTLRNAILLAGALAVIGLAVVAKWITSSSVTHDRRTPPSSQPSAAVPPSASIATPSLASAGASSAPIASSSSAPAPGTSTAPALVDESGPDGTDLLTIEGYLVVQSSASADVYATGVKVGTTNAKNKSRCGQKYVRIGEGNPPRWLGLGRTVRIACQSVTKVSIDPKP